MECLWLGIVAAGIALLSAWLCQLVIKAQQPDAGGVATQEVRP